MANALRSISLSQIKSRLLNVSQTSLYELTLGIPEAVRRRLPFSGFDYDNINFNLRNVIIKKIVFSTQ